MKLKSPRRLAHDVNPRIRKWCRSLGEGSFVIPHLASPGIRMDTKFGLPRLEAVRAAGGDGLLHSPGLEFSFHGPWIQKGFGYM